MGKGTIKEILDVGASIITLVVVDEDGDTNFLKAEGRLTIGALEDAFGGDHRNAIGQTIGYEMTEFGILASFSPEAGEVKSTVPVAPLIHLNGTSGEELVAQVAAALDAANTLLGALNAARPHGRDYYLLPDGAFGRASEQARAREAKVTEVIGELKAIRIQLRKQQQDRRRK